MRKLAHISALTYPAFLIHHKLIALMTAHMDLAHFTRGNSVALYFLYLTLVFALSVLLYKVTKYLTKRITARQPSVAAKK